MTTIPLSPRILTRNTSSNPTEHCEHPTSAPDRTSSPTEQSSRQSDTESRAPVGMYLAPAAALFAVGALLALAVISEFRPVISADQWIAPRFFEMTIHYPFIESLAAFWHLMGTSNVATPIVVTVVIVLLLARRPTAAAYLVVCSLGGLLISESLKELVGRSRPDWVDPFFTEAGNSFPSGHSLSGVCTWVALGLICTHVARNRGGLLFGWALIIFGALMAPSRLFFGVHWTSDVLAGWAFGFGWLLLVTAIFIAIKRRRTRSQPKQAARVTSSASTSEAH